MLGVKQLEEGGGSWKWSNIFFEEYICTREKNDWSSCFGSLSFFLFFQSVRIFNLRNWFCLLFPGLPFSTIVSVEEFLNWFSLHPFLFFFTLDRIFIDFVPFISQFFCNFICLAARIELSFNPSIAGWIWMEEVRVYRETRNGSEILEN